MRKGDYVNTPRFLRVRLEAVYGCPEELYAEGYKEPTHYKSEDYTVLGKSIGDNRMLFAAAPIPAQPDASIAISRPRAIELLSAFIDREVAKNGVQSIGVFESLIKTGFTADELVREFGFPSEFADTAAKEVNYDV